MTAPPARNDIGGSGNPSRATAKLSFTQMFDYVVERLGGTAATADSSEQTAARTALGAGTVGHAVFASATAAAAQTAVGVARGMQPISAAVASNALTFTLNPTTIEFRNATLGSGTANMRSVASAINLVISSGSTLGTVSGVPSRIALLAIDNAGTVELAAVNANGGFHFDESQLIATTAEGGAGAADSAAAVYSTTARSNVPFRFIGYVESSQGTAGTWATAPSKIQGGGGALPAITRAAMSFIGTPVASTSGTSIDFTNIPSWVKEINVFFEGVSTNGTSTPIVQLGDAGGFETTGYAGAMANMGDASASTVTPMSVGFAFAGSMSAAVVIHATLTLRRSDPTANKWSATIVGGRSDASNALAGGGSKALSDVLTQLRITTVGGVNTFDAGTVNVSWS